MKHYVIISVLLVLLSGCGTSTPLTSSQRTRENITKTIDNIPIWYSNTPKNTEDTLFASGTGRSANLAMAGQKALITAQRKLADVLNATVTAMTQQFQADVGDENINNIESTTKKFIATISVTGYTISKTVVIADGRFYRTYTLLKLPLGQTNAILRNARREQARSHAAKREIEQRKALNKAGKTHQKYNALNYTTRY